MRYLRERNLVLNIYEFLVVGPMFIFPKQYERINYVQNLN